MSSAQKSIASDLFEAIEETSQSIFYVIQNGRFVWGNRKGCRITGLDNSKDVLGKPGLSFVHPEDKPLITHMSRKVMKGESIQPFEFRLCTVEGQVVWVLGFLMKIRFKGQPALLGNYIDVTQAKQTQLELECAYKRVEDLCLNLKAVREEERAQIAWELHDNLGHTLTSLKTGIADLLSGELPNGRHGDILLNKVDMVLDTLSRISTHLIPVERDHPELSSAIRSYANEFGDRTGIRLNLKTPRKKMEIGEKPSLAIYGIFQETLKTLAALGRFKQLDLLLEWKRSRLELQLTGKAGELRQRMDVEGVRHAFQSLSIRIEEWNGALTIEQNRERLRLSVVFNLALGAKAHGVRVLFACSQPILMQGIKQMLAGLPEFIVSDLAETWLELTEKVKQPDVDMLLLDTPILGGRMTDNLSKLKEISPYLPILVLHSKGDDDDLAVRMLRRGASGYLSRSSSTDELVAAIHKVAGGRKHISNRIAEKLAFEVDIYSPKPFHHRLSDRERQVMFMIAEGKTMKEIASDLRLSYKTVITYKNRVFDKMNFSNNVEIVRYVLSKGLI